MNKNLIVAAAIGIGVIITAIAVIAVVLNRSGTPVRQPGQHAVVVSVLPRNATIQIAGSEDTLTNNHVNYLEPGEYTVNISSDNYAPEEMSFTVKEDLRPKVITALSSVGDHAASYDNDDLMELERVSGRASAEYTELYDSKYPAKKLLPFRDPYYRIGYSTTDGTDFFITVHTESPLYRERALRKIISLGISPSKYKIVFRDYEFPIKGTQ